MVTSEDTTHAAALERARSVRAPYQQALRYSRWSGGKFVWLYAIGWPTVVLCGYGIVCLAQGDLRNGIPALVLGLLWALVVLAVVAVVTSSIRAAGRRLKAFAERASGIAFRSSLPDRTLAWLDQHWAEEGPLTVMHDPGGSAYFVGAEATYAGAPVLIVGVRANFWPRVHQLIFFGAPGVRLPDEASRARVELAELGYVVSTPRSGVLVTRQSAPASAFDFDTLDRVLRLLAELAGATHADGDHAKYRQLRQRLRALSLERFKSIVDFTEKDLALNAAGHLSFRQRARSAARGTLWALVALAAAAWGAHVAIAIINPATRRDVVGGILVIVGMVVFSVGFSVFAAELLRDAVDGHAGLVLGPLHHTTTQGSKGGVQHWLQCCDIRFSVSPAIVYAIETDVPYRVYYALHSHGLLSLERVS
jgi:hypothetical protein